MGGFAYFFAQIAVIPLPAPHLADAACTCGCIGVSARQTAEAITSPGSQVMLHPLAAQSEAPRSITRNEAAAPCGPAGPAGPAAPGGPAGPAGPCSPLAPASPLSPFGPDGPAGPAGPAMPAGPASPLEPCGPAGPAGPATPAGPTSPLGPCGPGGPAGPAGPAGPMVPAGPAGPAGPATPRSPLAPGGPAGPAAPCGPFEQLAKRIAAAISAVAVKIRMVLPSLAAAPTLLRGFGERGANRAGRFGHDKRAPAFFCPTRIGARGAIARSWRPARLGSSTHKRSSDNAGAKPDYAQARCYPRAATSHYADNPRSRSPTPPCGARIACGDTSIARDII
jgi:hypothetical protein